MVTQKTTSFQSLWRSFCQSVVKVFYRSCEVDGLELLPSSGPVLLCANHANALADAVIIQAIITRTVHPLARSGLFKNPFLRPILTLQQAVPIYRRSDANSDTARNVDSFARCYRMFEQGGLILIFPEGQSHSDPKLRTIKTGAARMTLATKETNGKAPLIIPMGLSFTHKGKFRSGVFVKFGHPIDTSKYHDSQNEDEVRQLTQDIQNALDEVTLNVDKWEDLDLLKRIERFFSMRHGKYRKRNLKQRFRALKELINAQQKLRLQAPTLVENLSRKMSQYERLCKRWGIRDYHTIVRYQPMLVTRFILRSLAIIFILLPLAAWGIVNSIIPFMLTRYLARLGSKGTDQYDTAKMVLGLLFYSLFWGGQIILIYQYLGAQSALLYSASLPPTAAAALTLRKERERIWENIRVFILFVRKKKLRRYMEARRKEIEKELAHFVRLVKTR